MDSLSLKDIELQTSIGITEEERKTPQRLLVSIKLELDLSVVGESDAMADTVDYDHLLKDIRGLATGSRRTIERFAQEMVNVVLQRNTVKTVTVSVTKFPYADVKNVTATITRSKQ